MYSNRILIDNTLYTKEELLRRIKSYLKSAPEGAITHPVFEKRIYQLLLLHPDAHRKISKGIEAFGVERNHAGSGKSFIIIHSDLSVERFSYKSCIVGADVTKRSKAVEAFRFIVRPQILEFKKSTVLPVQCAITGEVIASNDHLEIDHKIPFSKLLNNFCLNSNLSLSQIETVGNGEELKLVDQQLAQGFYTYHKNEAVLQPVIKAVNREKSNKLI